MNNKLENAFAVVKGSLAKHKNKTLAIAAGVLVPAAFVMAQVAGVVSSPSTVINCMVAGSCNVVVAAETATETGATFGANAYETTNWISGYFSDSLSAVNASSSALKVSAVDATDVTDFIGFATTSLNVDSIGAGGATTSALTFAGSSVGDSVAVWGYGNWGASTNTVALGGFVSAANSITLTFVNTSSSAVDLTSAQYGIEVRSH